MKKLVVVGVLVLLALRGNAQEKRETLLDRVNDAMSKAAAASGIIKEHGEPRRVLKGAKPELVLRDDQLIFNGMPLRLGQALEKWETVLPGTRRCQGEKIIDGCVWDDAGILVVMQNTDPTKIGSVKIYLQLPDEEEREPLQPTHAFNGYLELDGFGMDTETQFWEVRKSVRKERNIRCGLRDCAAPHGALGKTTAIYFMLSKPNENGTLRAVELGGGIL